MGREPCSFCALRIPVISPFRVRNAHFFGCYLLTSQFLHDTLASLTIAVVPPMTHTLYLWITMLVGGLEHFLFFHILGMIIPTDFHIFHRGWNQQSVWYIIGDLPCWVATHRGSHAAPCPRFSEAPQLWLAAASVRVAPSLTEARRGQGAVHFTTFRHWVFLTCLKQQMGHNLASGKPT